MASLSLKNVSGTDSNRGEIGIINNFSLDIADRELVVLTGPSRCGMNQIVRLIAGLDRVSRGDLLIGDRPVNEMPPKKRDVALVPQNYIPYPQMTVRENIAFPLIIRKRSEAELKKRVSIATELSGLGEMLDCKPGSLSRETRQRLAIARAIALNPKVFLFDDPLAGLDETAHQRLRNEISKLYQRLPGTIVYGTHDPAEAMAMGGRLVVLKEGKIVQTGEPASLYREPANIFIAEFIAMMNLIAGTLKRERDSLLFVERDQGTIKLRLPIRENLPMPEHSGIDVLLGVHPEGIEMAGENTAGSPSDGLFPAIIDRVELMAGAVNVYLHTGAHSVVCRAPATSVVTGAGRRSQFQIELGSIRLFEPKTGQKIG